MNRDHLLRIAWKDHRRMRALWFGMAGLWSCLLIYTTSRSLVRGSSDISLASSEVMVLLIPFFLIIYGLAWAAVTFSTEHDDGTYLFLRSLPIDAKHLFFGKFSYGVASTTLMAFALLVPCLLARYLLSNRGLTPDPDKTIQLGLVQLAIFLVALIPLTLTVGVFWSLKLRRPLVSLLATAASLLVAPIIPFFCDLMYRSYTGRMSVSAAPAEIGVTCIILFLLAVAFYARDRFLVEQWLPNSSLRQTNPFASSAASRASDSRRLDTKTLTHIGRLFWLQTRQDSWKVLAPVFVVCCVFGFLMFETTRVSVSGTVLFITPLPMMFLAGFVGVMVFRPEQHQQRFRFLSQLGVHPATYWLSRVMLPFCLATLIAMLATIGTPSQHIYVIFGAMSAFAIGQLASLMSASTVIACALTLVGFLASWNWITLCRISRIPLWLGAAPTIALPLLASYWRVPRWFQQNESWKQWVVPMLPIIALVTAVPLASVLYRIYEMPTANLPDEFLTFDISTPETDGSGAYRQLFATLPNAPDTSSKLSDNVTNPFFRSWMERTPEYVPQLLTAIKQGGPIPEEYRRIDAATLPTGEEAMLMSATCLVLSGNDALDAGDVETAWDRYQAALLFTRHLHDGRAGTEQVKVALLIEDGIYEQLVPWAMAPENTRTTIERAATFINDFRGQQISPKTALIVDYHSLQQVWDDPRQFTQFHDQTRDWARYAKTLFWERERSQRMMNLQYTAAYKSISNPHASDNSISPDLTKSTLFANAMPSSSFAVSVHHNEHVRRGTICQLALIAYRREHNTYPSDLSQIRLNGESLPTDVYSPGEQLNLLMEQFHVVTSPPDQLPALPSLASKAAKQDSVALTSDGQGRNRLFLLPTLDDWDLNKFKERKFLTSSKKPPPIQPEAEQLEFNSRELTYALVDTLFEIEPEQTEAALLHRVREIFLSADVDLQIATAERLGHFSPDDKLAEDLVPVLTQVLDGNDVEAAAASARLLQVWITTDSNFVIKHQLSDRVSELREYDSTIELKLPIRNPATGYYYDYWGESGPKDVAVSAAPECRFRNIQGRIPIQEVDSEFLQKAFPGVRSYWYQDLPEDTQMGLLQEPSLVVEYAVEAAEQESPSETE